jgi:hypothetical protein
MIECGVDASYNFRRDYLRFHPEKAWASKSQMVLTTSYMMVKMKRSSSDFSFQRRCGSVRVVNAPFYQSKDENAGTMVSAFVTREYGIIWEISGIILDEVNKQRLGKVYADAEVAIEILGRSHRTFISLKTEKIENAFGLTTTWSFSLRMQLMSFEPCIQTFLFFLYLTTARTMQNNVPMVSIITGWIVHLEAKQLGCEQPTLNKNKDSSEAFLEPWSLEIRNL